MKSFGEKRESSACLFSKFGNPINHVKKSLFYKFILKAVERQIIHSDSLVTIAALFPGYVLFRILVKILAIQLTLV